MSLGRGPSVKALARGGSDFKPQHYQNKAKQQKKNSVHEQSSLVWSFPLVASCLCSVCFGVWSILHCGLLN
jgi:hypothetical protein